MTVHISQGNTKLGMVSNVSLLPGLTCNNDAPCKKRGCYAMKFCKLRPNVRKAWKENTDIAKSNSELYFSEITGYIAHKKPEFFRWHVGGDILDQNYLDQMVRIAKNCPGVSFLAFTKMHNLDFSNAPFNLAIIFSMWPGFGDTEKKMPRAWLDDGTDKRIPNDAIKCPGNCESCGMCWALPRLGRDVAFKKH